MISVNCFMHQPVVNSVKDNAQLHRCRLLEKGKKAKCKKTFDLSFKSMLRCKNSSVSYITKPDSMRF